MKKETIQALVAWLQSAAPKAITGQHFAETAALIKALQAELTPPAVTPPPVPAAGAATGTSVPPAAKP